MDTSDLKHEVSESSDAVEENAPETAEEADSEADVIIFIRLKISFCQLKFMSV